MDYKQLQTFDLAGTVAIEISPDGLAVAVRCFDSNGTPVHLHMSRTDLERLLLQANRELERVPLPARDPSSR
jgi:hypothetical protein